MPNMHDLPFLKAKYDMTTFDPVLVKASSDFMDKAKKDNKPFFVWHNTTRMHVWTFLSKKYSSMQNSQTNYGLEEAGMADMDDNIGTLLKHLDDIGEADNTIVVFTTDNGAEVFTWPDGGMTPFKNTKGTVGDGGFRVPCVVRWPGHIKPGTVENGIFSGLDWFPTFMAAAGNPDITNQLLKGVKLGDRATRTIWTATTRWLCWKARGHPRGMNCSTSVGLISEPFALMTSSSCSSNSLGAGREKRSRRTCRYWSISGRIRLSGRHLSAASPRTTAPSATGTISLPASSGASFWSNNKSRSLR